MKFYNTLSKKEEEFVPLKRKRVGIYQCGPTLYWRQHIGNMRGMFVGDIVERTFEYLGYKVLFVRNYTDVGHLTSDSDSGADRMAKGAEREQTTPEAVAQKYKDLFEKDLRALNIAKGDKTPMATHHIKEMIVMIKQLLKKGFAYETDLAIYFDITKAKEYTRLSGQVLENQEVGAGHGDAADAGKQNPRDFALWFFKAGAHAHALQTWPSPFHSSLVENGEGFPGWHIECSAMSKKYLGETFDIHMGGIEHIPVHHTNEIAQSESASGKQFVRYWLHNEHLLIDGKKMSKSEGTSYSLQDITDKGFDPLDLRFFFLGAHYRSKQNFTWEALAGARSGFEHLKNQVRNLGKKTGRIHRQFKKEFEGALGDDLNTPKALAVVQELLKSEIKREDKLATVLDFDRVFGLNLGTVGVEVLPEKIQRLADERAMARMHKDFGRSDELRTELETSGYAVEDTAEGQRIYRK